MPGAGPASSNYVLRERGDVTVEARDAVTRAVTEVSLAAGLAFVVDGYGQESPSDDRGTRIGPSTTAPPVLIAWSDPAEPPSLEGRVVGDGGPVFTRGPDGYLRTTSGSVRLDTPRMLRMLERPDGDAEAQSVVMHELAHVLGAGHAESSDELMAASVGRTTFGDGDRYALARLGRGRCG